MTTRLDDWDGVPVRSGPQSSVTGGYLRWHAKYYFLPILSLVLIYLVTLGIAYGFAKSGNLGAIGAMAMITAFVIILLGFMWGNLGIVIGLAYADGNIGGVKDGKEEGLDISDGVKAIKKGLPFYAKKVLILAIYVVVPFVALFILALLGPEHVDKAIWILPASFLTMIGVMAFWPGSAFAKFIVLLCLSGILFVFGLAIWQGLSKRYVAYQAEQAASAPVNVQAEREEVGAKLTYLQQQAADCSKALATLWKAGTPPTEAAQADCRRKQAAARGETMGNTPSPSASPVVTTTVYRAAHQATYVPSETKGAISLGRFEAGQYCLKTTGLRQQVFYYGAQTNSWEMDGMGRLSKRNWETWESGNGEGAKPPFPHEAYGAVFTIVNGQRHWVWTDSFKSRPFPIANGEEVFADLNVANEFPQLYAGVGSLTLRVEKC